jgi:flagellar export protein FliJ
VRKALAALLRVRDAHKKVAEREFGAAERERIRQEGQVDSIQHAMISSHTGDELGYPGGDASWLAIEHSFRLRMLVRLRKEEAVLHQCSQESAIRRDRLVEADRERRVVELALEQHDAAVALEQRRSDGRKIDSMASMRWWREQDV